MRSLPTALAAAQLAASGSPAISAVLRAKRGSAARLDVTTLYTGALTDVPTAVVEPANGSTVRAQLAGGNVQVNVQPSYGSWTVWGTIAAAFAPAAGLGVALCCLGIEIYVVYLTDATHWALRASYDAGSTWSAVLASGVSAGTITDLAIAFAPDGEWLLVTGDSSGVLRTWRNGVVGASLTPTGSEFINSVSVAYVNDWLVLFGWQTADLTPIGSAIFGNGTLQATNTWSAVVDVLGIAPGNSDVPVVTGFAWNADGGHAIIVENWALLGGYNANNAYAMHCSSAAAFAGGFWTEPEPFPYTSATASTFFGPDIAPSQVAGQTGSYVAGATNLVATLAPPADLDVSARVIAIDYVAEQHAGTAVVMLDNSDQGITYLATQRNTIGLRLDLSLGYNTPSGVLTSQLPLRWVVKVEDSYVSGRHLLTLTCHDGWQLLHQLTSRREAQFGTTLGLPTLTVDQILHLVLARAGIDYTSPGASTLRSRTPNFNLAVGRSLGVVMLDLLDSIEGWLLMTATGATIIPLGTGDASTYSFGGAGQQPVLQVFHTQEVQPANLITVYTGTAGALPEIIAAQAFGNFDSHLLGTTAHDHVDVQLETANAQATANALLRKAQVSFPQHSFISLPQVAQELGDVIAVTDPLTAVVYSTRVQAFTFRYDRDKGVWQQAFSTSAV